MRFQFLSFCCFAALLTVNPVSGSDACILDGNSEIVDTNDCEFAALKLKYIVKDISFCTELPVPNQFDSCESWEIPEFEFEITNNSVTEVQVGSDLPRGTYTWMSLTLNPRREVTAIATFNRTMQGSSSSGKKCWTNGGTVNRGTTAYRETDRSKWTAESGEALGPPRSQRQPCADVTPAGGRELYPSVRASGQRRIPHARPYARGVSAGAQ